MSYQVTAEKVHTVIQIWDRCMRESGVSCSYYPSDRKVMDWIEQYSSALVEEAIEEGIPRSCARSKRRRVGRFLDQWRNMRSITAAAFCAIWPRRFSTAKAKWWNEKASCKRPKAAQTRSPEKINGLSEAGRQS